MEKERGGYMTEYVRPAHPTCQEPDCDKKVKLEARTAGGELIGLFCQSDGIKALREHNRTTAVGTTKEAAAR